MYPIAIYEIFAVGFGLLIGVLLASGVDQILGWYGLVALASLTLAVTAVLSLA